MLQNKKRVAYYTLGCKLNFSETSTIARQLDELGYQRVSPTSEADLYVINTCSVTQQADRKCRQAIRKFVTRSPHAFIAVVGCFAQLKPDEIASIPGVDLVLGSGEKGNIPLHIGNSEKLAKAKIYSCETDAITDFFPAYSSADRTRSFLKVQDGCSYHCAYCAIPLARGESRNPPIQKVVEQAKQIASLGVKEVIITGVNTGDFGRSTGESFFDLLKELDGVDGIERYRISSIEPNLITNEIIEYIASSKRFTPHFHIPLQSGSDRILGLMGRRYNSSLFSQKVRSIKHFLPQAFIGVDVIVGFPGETPEDFECSYNLLNELQPSALHVFPYSRRPGTKADTMPYHINHSTVKGRTAKLQELSVHLHRMFNQHALGSTEFALFESTKKGEYMHGYTRNYVRVEHPYSRDSIGKVLKVKLIGIKSNGNVAVTIDE